MHHIVSLFFSGDLNFFANFSPRSEKRTVGEGQLDLLSLSSPGSAYYDFSTLYATLKIENSKLKELEWSQHFSHYKSMAIFPNAQGQVTHKSLVRCC